MAPAPREIPPGKILVAEYSEVDESNRSELTIHERQTIGTTEYLLYSRSPGFQPAGSCCTWTNGYHGVRYMLRDAWHGRTFREYDDAAQHFGNIIDKGKTA